MYLYYVLPEIERGEISESELPQGLMDYYERHWQKMKSRNLNHWLNLQQPVICVLAAVQESVTIKQIMDFNPGLNQAQVVEVIGQWQQFLRESIEKDEKLYRLYHKSFQDFLKQKDEVDWKQINRSIAQVLEKLTSDNW